MSICPVSVVVPVWNDSRLIGKLLEVAPQSNNRLEWIVAAVQPSPSLQQLARDHQCKLIDCPTPSRGNQMNRGAAVAEGEIICFHHADSDLLSEHCDALTTIADDTEIVGGAFEREFDSRHTFMRGFQNSINRINRHIGPFFGDQSIFVRRKTFQQLGGFADIPLMEDLEFSQRLRKSGRIALLAPPMATSKRRFKKLGSFRCTLFNAFLICSYYSGVSPARLHQWYYRTAVSPE